MKSTNLIVGVLLACSAAVAQPWKFDNYGRSGNGQYGTYGDAYSTLNCSSNDMRRHYCDVDTRGGVRLVRQRSQAVCREGSTWGYNRSGIWVDRGCRADFQITSGGSYRNERGYGRDRDYRDRRDDDYRNRNDRYPYYRDR